MAEPHGTGSKDEGLHTPRVRGVPVRRDPADPKSATRDSNRTLSVNPFVSSAADPLGAMQLAPPMYRISDQPMSRSPPTGSSTTSSCSTATRG